MGGRARRDALEQRRAVEEDLGVEEATSKDDGEQLAREGQFVRVRRPQLGRDAVPKVEQKRLVLDERGRVVAAGRARARGGSGNLSV